MESDTATRILVAASVRAEIARRGITQTALADALGLSQQAVSRRLTGAVAFDIDEIAAVSALLGIPVAQLIEVAA